MQERGKHHDKTKELLGVNSVGLRLQDVVLNPSVVDSNVLEVRQNYIEKYASKFESDRIAVLNAVTDKMFGVVLEEALGYAKMILKPYSGEAHNLGSLIISSASSSSGSQEAEIDFTEKFGHPIDIPGAIEGRDTRSSESGDTALISTYPGLIMARAKGDVNIINLTEERVATLSNGKLDGADIYYKADGLLLLMLSNPESPVIHKLKEEILSGKVVYPYNLDEETQICLLWLAREVEVAQIKVNANSPDVAVNLTKKGFRYPQIETALKLKTQKDAKTMQRNEWRLSQNSKEVGYYPDAMPGYLINHGVDFSTFKTNAISALMLLATRYGLDSAWSKPDRGTDGGNQEAVQFLQMPKDLIQQINRSVDIGDIKTAISLFTQSQEIQALERRIEKMWSIGSDWVIEAKTNYFDIPFDVDGKTINLRTAPSVHIINGVPRTTISLQILDDKAWGGNFICSEENWSKLVDMIKDERISQYKNLKRDLKSAYPIMTSRISGYTKAINASMKYKNGQVRGGADLAVATLGGNFDQELIIAVQDYNARANGCETAYSLYDFAKKQFGESGEAVTRNITPLHNFNYFQDHLSEIIDSVNLRHNLNIEPYQVKIIAVSSGWGQFGVMGTDGMGVLKSVFLIEDEMRNRGLIK